jgi:hypothetical protein
MTQRENPGLSPVEKESPAGSRAPRRNRGRSWVDWEELYVYYASLPPGKRSYAAVAAKFGVSVRTVETHGRTERWQERVRALKQEVANRNQEMLVEGRVEEEQTIRRLIGASLIAYEERLGEGMRMGPADLERLHRLSRTLLDELTESGQTSESSAASVCTPEHQAAVLDALAETGALEKLGLKRIAPPDPVTQRGGQDDKP